MFASLGLRLAAIYTAAFALAVAALGAGVLLATRAAMTEQFQARIQAEAGALMQEYRSEGLNGVLQAVQERERTPGALDFGLVDVRGRPLAGRLAVAAGPEGWSIARAPTRGGRLEGVRLLTMTLPNGDRLVVGDDLDRVQTLDGVLLKGFAAALVGVVLLGGVGGYALSRDVQRRFAAMSGVAEAIIDGDLARRLPVRGGGDDLDRLALTFNRMLDRIGALMESLRQVSSDIAHDLRTPLARMRQGLEEGLRSGDAARRDQAMEQALHHLDAALETFAGLLRIAEVESGARRAAFRPLDLSETARLVVESFSPAAEDEGRRLLLDAPCPALVTGDADLLTQMLVNLVENGLRHTPTGSTVRVTTGSDQDAATLSVIDDGPGVPEAERERIFGRFYRLERSRSTPGSGLGLALVSAVAKLHGGAIALMDVAPGLGVRVSFPSSPAAKVGVSQS